MGIVQTVQGFNSPCCDGIYTHAEGKLGRLFKLIF